MAYDGEIGCGEHELLRADVRGRDYLLSSILARLWSQALHWSGAGNPELVEWVSGYAARGTETRRGLGFGA